MKFPIGSYFYGLAAVCFIYIFTNAFRNDRKNHVKTSLLVQAARFVAILVSTLVLWMVLAGEM